MPEDKHDHSDEWWSWHQDPGTDRPGIYAIIQRAAVVPTAQPASLLDMICLRCIKMRDTRWDGENFRIFMDRWQSWNWAWYETCHGHGISIVTYSMVIFKDLLRQLETWRHLKKEHLTDDLKWCWRTGGQRPKWPGAHVGNKRNPTGIEGAMWIICPRKKVMMSCWKQVRGIFVYCFPLKPPNVLCQNIKVLT